jgi:3-keto-L-gulonate-6-phosphate decarboxylase
VSPFIRRVIRPQKLVVALESKRINNFKKYHMKIIIVGRHVGKTSQKGNPL